MTIRCKTLSLWMLFIVVSLSTANADDPPKSAKPAAAAMLGKEAGDMRDDNGLKMKLVWCPPGLFEMGEAEGSHARTVLTCGYWIAKYECTQAQWMGVMETKPWTGKDFWIDGDEFPATFVSWTDAVAFCWKLTARERAAARLPEGWEYTLPTDAQWEYACRARTETKFSFGDDKSKLGDYAWFSDNNMGHVSPVGRKEPNRWGLHDMHGNVGEWCRDHFTENPPGGRDPKVTTGSGHTVRGGDWNASASQCRSGSRQNSAAPPSARSYDIGFRVALTPVQPSK